MAALARLSPPILQTLSRVAGVDYAAPEAKTAQEIARGVAALFFLFTRQRDGLAGPYLERDDLRRAYVAYYLPVNLAKVQSLLKELPAWPTDPASAGRPFRVLDIGSGPGTAVLAVLDWMAAAPNLSARPLECVAIDRSPMALGDCACLWETYRSLARAPGGQLRTVCEDVERTSLWRRWDRRSSESFDVIVLANALGELFISARDPLAPRVALVSSLLDLLDPAGTLMIIEPALRDTSRALHRLRDRLLEDKVCTVYSPCLHEQTCPALVKVEDWCHEERQWVPPPIVSVIDRDVGLIKDALKFSYLLLRKDGRTIVPRRTDVYRVVSELRKMKGEKRVWLCNETGRPEVGLLDRMRSETNAPFEALHRGAIVKIDQIVRGQRKGREATVGRIPESATVEVIRSV
ncbi:MAG TPA: small ribosomal subunit Rsm22 family protein [Nitrospiraceae bacterium]|jgi:ribosomal protein RSM22 (predicted rRNA methylase)|nr:small ribosomal subunit Rsm22 family protein [Nitrospiraceae bacterium]